jgi:hypothetical protein
MKNKRLEKILTRKSLSQSSVLKIVSFLTTHEMEEEINIVFSFIKCRLNGLEYNMNSCYQDSILMSLFCVQNKFVKNEILKKEKLKPNVEKVRDELVAIYKTINRKTCCQVKTCDKLRKALSKCVIEGMENFHSTEMQDAGEFLQYIFALFNVKTSPIILVPSYENDITLKCNKNRHFAVFYVQRLLSHRKRQFNSITIPEYIGKLTIYSIIVHKDNHYTCYLKNNDMWYYYNDLVSEITFVGDFKNVLNCSIFPNVQTEGVLYFYIKN